MSVIKFAHIHSLSLHLLKLSYAVQRKWKTTWVHQLQYLKARTHAKNIILLALNHIHSYSHTDTHIQPNNIYFLHTMKSVRNIWHCCYIITDRHFHKGSMTKLYREEKSQNLYGTLAVHIFVWDDCALKEIHMHNDRKMFR